MNTKNSNSLTTIRNILPNSTEPIVVSIIIITYNHQEYIEEAINGVLNQKVSFNIEILIHDDASTDNTIKIINQFKVKYPHLITLIKQEENQYSKNRKPWEFVYYKAKGKYIALCEGDDYWISPLKIEKQVQIINKDPKISMVFTARKTKDQINDTQSTQSSTKSYFTLKDINSNFVPYTQTSLFKNNQNLIQFRNKHNHHPSGDQLNGLYAALYGQIYYLNEVTAVYRLTGKGMYSSRIDNHEKSIQLYKNFSEILKEEKAFNYLYFQIGMGRKLLTSYGLKGSFTKCRVLTKLEILISIFIYYIYRSLSLFRK